MSDLQIWLLVIGVAVVLAVLAFNWTQERRFRKQADAAFQSPTGDALMESSVAQRETIERVEPGLRESAYDDADESDDDVSVEPHLSNETARPAELRGEDRVAAASARIPEKPVAPASVSTGTQGATPAPYDDLIEYRIRVGGEDVQASVFADAYNQARTLGKAVRWMGLPVGSTEWEDVQPWRDVNYQQVVVTLQLADRNGAVLSEQLFALCTSMQTIARAHGLHVACDDVADAQERAQAIDRFCVDVDVLIGLNVVARGEGAVNLTRIVREAEGNGMVLGVDGVFQLLDSRGEPLYALCNHDAEPFSATVVEGQASQGVTLQFDVPRVPDGLKVFDGMVAFGRKLANEVGGILVDDNLRPLTDTGIEKIRVQLMQIYERMDARGVPSGSRRALRLFS